MNNNKINNIIVTTQNNYSLQMPYPNILVRESDCLLIGIGN